MTIIDFLYVTVAIALNIMALIGVMVVVAVVDAVLMLFGVGLNP